MDAINRVGKDLTDINALEDDIENISDPFDMTNRKPMFNFFGITDLSFYDYFLGLATGVYGRDVRQEWHQCMGGPLLMFRDMMKLIFEFIGQDWTNIMGVITNFVLLQHMFDLVMEMVKGLPNDIKACGGIYTEISETIAFIIKHINPASLLTNAAANPLKHKVVFEGGGLESF
jgi:hypothetical protein